MAKKPNPYTNLAKLAVETYIKEKKICKLPKNLPKEFLTQKAGVFVTITKNGQLRGCIGTYLATKKNIAEEIITNAIASATQDFRFNPVKEDELEQLSYSVYILETPSPIKSLDQLDPKKYGILVRSDTGKSGLLLPDLDGIDTVEKQLSAVCFKCGILPQKEKITICRFKAKKYEE